MALDYSTDPFHNVPLQRHTQARSMGHGWWLFVLVAGSAGLWYLWIQSARASIPTKYVWDEKAQAAAKPDSDYLALKRR